MSTNGALLTPEVAAEVDYLRVSLNAGTAAQHTRTNRRPARPPRRLAADPTRIALALPARRGTLASASWWTMRTTAISCRSARWRPSWASICPHPPGLLLRAGAGRPGAGLHVRRAEDLRARQSGACATPPLKIFSIAEKFEGYWTPRSYHACRAVLTGVTLRATGDFAVCQDRTDLVFGAAYRQGAAFEGGVAQR